MYVLFLGHHHSNHCIVILKLWNLLFLILQLEYEVELFPLANLAIELKIEDLSATRIFWPEKINFNSYMAQDQNQFQVFLILNKKLYLLKV